ncbi:hypothetical protein [Jannaschia sp. LMIT008]|uniref:hypothetical protein n=1 Tax=Jannaschia maritima TaxID=3032585 RepID=UPI0028124891|nr:hypothetical protein [Jannaschia sp. LMIT008]
MIRTTILVLTVACAAQPAAAQDRYVGVVVGTAHVGTGDLNDVNPGVTFGRRWDAARPGWEWHVEGGVFYNSYREVSPIVLAGLSAPLTRVPGGELRGALSVGTAYYDELANEISDIPNLEGFIPLATATLAYRREQAEYRLTLLPTADDVDAVINLSVAIPF